MWMFSAPEISVSFNTCVNEEESGNLKGKKNALFDYYKSFRCKIGLKGQKCPVLSLSYFPHIYLIAELQGSSKAPLARKLVNHQAKKISLWRHHTPNRDFKI